jgi:arylsulfatase A
LNKLGLGEKTLVIFSGDNGTHRSLVSNLRGQVVRGDKGLPTDAGTHVPLIAKWKGVIPAGTSRDDLIDFTDFLPTLAAVTGAMLPAGVVIDGKSFAPQLRGMKGSPREWVFCHYDPKWANFKFSRHAQDKRYKLYHDGSFFDYRHDPLEKSPIAKQAMTSEQRKARDRLQPVLDSLK